MLFSLFFSEHAKIARTHGFKTVDKGSANLVISVGTGNLLLKLRDGL